MKINSELGYEPVTYSELTTDEAFWNGCKSCVNYQILTSKDFKNCLCTAMLYEEPKLKTQLETKKNNHKPKLLKVLSNISALTKLKIKQKTNE